MASWVVVGVVKARGSLFGGVEARGSLLGPVEPCGLLLGSVKPPGLLFGPVNPHGSLLGHVEPRGSSLGAVIVVGGVEGRRAQWVVVGGCRARCGLQVGPLWAHVLLACGSWVRCAPCDEEGGQ